MALSIDKNLKILLGVILFCSINPILILNQNENIHIVFSDNFNDDGIDPIWTVNDGAFSSIIESNGSLKAVPNPETDSWTFMSLEKSFNQNVSAISVEFNYSLKGDGGLFLIGRASNKDVWGLGLASKGVDGNVYPYIYSTAQLGIFRPDPSWNIDNSLNINLNIIGNGSVYIEFLSNNEISVVFSYNEVNYSHETIVDELPDTIRLFFVIPHESDFVLGDYWEFDNYVEYKIERETKVLDNSTELETVVQSIFIGCFLAVLSLTILLFIRKRKYFPYRSNKATENSKNKVNKKITEKQEINELNTHLKSISEILNET